MKLSSALFSLSLCCFFFSSHSHAAKTPTCTPELTIHSYSYTPCQNLPLLDAANDSRVNMLLLLEDWGLAKTNEINTPQSLWLSSYSQVPFLTQQLLDHTQQGIKTQHTLFNPNHVSMLYDPLCQTLQGGHERFNSQVSTLLGVTRRDKKILLNAQQQLYQCDLSMQPLVILSQWSKSTQQYATFLNGNLAFAKKDFAKAREIYTELLSSTDVWLKDVAQYMIIRSHLAAVVESSKNAQGKIDLTQINYPELTQFFQEITQYFKLYPEGEYAVHVRGLLRHGYWLVNRPDLLADEIAWQIQHPQSKFYNLDAKDVSLEIEQRILLHPNFDPSWLKDPFLLTISNLMRMRQDNKSKIKPLRWTELNDQKDYYHEYPELFRYLRALHLLVVQNKPDEALQYLPLHQSVSASNHLHFSEIVLRGRIFEIKQQSYVNDYWLSTLENAKNSYQRGLYEVALYKYFSHPLHYEAFIGTNPIFQQSFIQRHFIQNIANEDTLQAMIQTSQSTAEQKQAATFVLMEKSLMHQNFALFNQAYRQWMPNQPQLYQGVKQHPPTQSYESQPPFARFVWNGKALGGRLRCASLIENTRRLAQQPKDQLARVCFGEYLRSDQGLPILKSIRNKQQSRTFAGPVFARGEVYRELIDQEKATELRAYALFRAVQCYAPAGINECGDSNVPLETRKEWFVALKKEYPNSVWAKNLIYYW